MELKVQKVLFENMTFLKFRNEGGNQSPHEQAGCSFRPIVLEHLEHCSGTKGNGVHTVFWNSAIIYAFNHALIGYSQNKCIIICCFN